MKGHVHQRKRQVTFLAVLAAIYAVGSTPIRAADIFAGESGMLYLVGPIETGDDEKFRDLLVAESKARGPDLPRWQLHLYSPGGRLSTAIAIGQQVRLLQLTTAAPAFYGKALPSNMAPGMQPRMCDLPGEKERLERVKALDKEQHKQVLDAYKRGKLAPIVENLYPTFDPAKPRGDPRCDCASSCFVIWASGVERLGDVIGVHRPRFDASVDFAGLPPSEARTKYNLLLQASENYLTSVGVGHDFIKKMFATSSATVTYLTPADLAPLRRSPHFEEYLIAKCGTLAGEAEISAIAKNKAALEQAPNQAFWDAEEHRRRVLIWANKVKCERDARSELYVKTAREYLARYEPTREAQQTPKPQPDRVAAEREAGTLLRKALPALSLPKVLVLQTRKSADADSGDAHALWTSEEPVLLGRVIIYDGTASIGKIADALRASVSSDCNGEVHHGALQFNPTGASMALVCQSSNASQAEIQVAFLRRKPGGFYVLETAGLANVEAGRLVHEKLVAAFGAEAAQHRR